MSHERSEFEERGSIFADCHEFRVNRHPALPIRESGAQDGESIETCHRFDIEVRLPEGVVIAPLDLLGPPTAGWGRMATFHIYTRPLGVGYMPPAALTETEGCYLEIDSGTARTRKAFGEAPDGSCAFRVSHPEIARPFRGRDLGRRILKTVLELVPEEPFVFGLDAIPSSPRESGRTDAEAQDRVERFWASIGFARCPQTQTTWTAKALDVDRALREVAPLDS